MKQWSITDDDGDELAVESYPAVHIIRIDEDGMNAAITLRSTQLRELRDHLSFILGEES